MKKIIKKRKKILLFLMNKGLFNWISDERFLKLKFKLLLDKKLQLENPKTFNEKLQWLKLYDRQAKYTKMVDKIDAKEYAEKIIGEKYIIPTIKIAEKVEDINYEELPKQFVIKSTHTSGNVFLCKDKSDIDIKKLTKQINRWLKRNYYLLHREWPYKNVRPRIIIEKYLKDDNQGMLNDYKLFCFNGNVKTILVCSNRTENGKNTNFYDCNWNSLPFTRANHENNLDGIAKPSNLDEMIEVAQKLSTNIPFVRVDLYDINGKIFFGELTFFPSAGFEGFNPPEYDEILGKMLVLPSKRIEGENESNIEKC